MEAKPELLCLGHDEVLNRTRRLILKRVFAVQLSCKIPEAVSLLSDRPFDLVLLCYSLSEHDARAMVEFIHSLPVQPKILALAQGRQRFHLTPPDEEYLLTGPAELLRKAAGMAGIRLEESGLPSESTRR